jgi:hypothetical protein
MTQTGRAWIGFLVAPGIPGILLYLWGLHKGYGNAAIVGPFLLAPFAYAAALIIGGPVYTLLQRKRIVSLGVCVGLGVAIGLVAVVLLTVGQALLGSASTGNYATTVLGGARGDILVAIVYAAVASAVFWLIAIRPNRSM